ncbi:unnamed protein product [Discosporangium mesarthrocarpum]
MEMMGPEEDKGEEAEGLNEDIMPSIPPMRGIHSIDGEFALSSSLSTARAALHRRAESESAEGMQRLLKPSKVRMESSGGLTWWDGGRAQLFGGKADPVQQHRRHGSRGMLTMGESERDVVDDHRRSTTGGAGNPRVPAMDRYSIRPGRQCSSRFNDDNGDEDDAPKLWSLSDLIRKEDKVPPTLYEHSGDTDVVIDVRDTSQQMLNHGAVGTQDSLQAAEHGNSIRLSRFLQDGGDPSSFSRLHHMGWSLLHLAAGCATMGGPLTFGYRSRPEPDCNDGYATCVAELLAAGADPNATSKLGGFTPLMAAALTGSKECCWLLLRAGAKVDIRAVDGRTAFDFSQQARYSGSSVQEAVLNVLKNPPKKVPRSPLMVQASLIEPSSIESEDGAPTVEVRWRVPSQKSLLPTRCGDIQKYYIKCLCKGKAREVVRTSLAGVLEQRRDFCRNQIIDRGIALRKNLSLPQSETASAIINGLEPGEYYSFTVACIAEIDGALRHSPPSGTSRPIFIPSANEEKQWHFGGVLSMIGHKDHKDTAGVGAVPQAQGGRGTQDSRGHTQEAQNQHNEQAKDQSYISVKEDPMPKQDQPYFSLQGHEGKQERMGYRSYRNRELRQDAFTTPGEAPQPYSGMRSPVPQRASRDTQGSSQGAIATFQATHEAPHQQNGRKIPGNERNRNGMQRPEKEGCAVS